MGTRTVSELLVNISANTDDYTVITDALMHANNVLNGKESSDEYKTVAKAKIRSAILAMLDSGPNIAVHPKPMHLLKVGDEGWLYDRYRFAVPLKGRIVATSEINDGIKVELLTSNALKYPIGSTTWVHAQQFVLK